MSSRLDKTRINTIIFLIAIVFAASLRHVPLQTDFMRTGVALLRPVIYICLFGAWGVSIGNRIVQETVRRTLMTIAALMIFWICARTLKFNSENIDVIRYAWYCYYIPQILIPTLFFTVSLLLGKNEKDIKSLKKISYPVLGVSMLLVLLVLTNDLHQLVFVFEGVPFDEKHYTHSYIFYAVWGWMVILALYSVVTIVRKCRVSEKKKFALLPLIAISAAFLYAVLSVLGNPVVKYIAGDMTVSFCVIYMFIIESCLRSGLIRINTGYIELFEGSSIRAQITDEDYNAFLSSKDAQTYPTEVLKQTEKGPVLLDDGIRLSNFKIAGGHVLWQEDTTELYKVMQELDEAKADLEGRNAVLAEAYNAERNLHRLEEQNRLYDSIQKKTSRQINMLSDLLSRYHDANTPEEREAILKNIIVVGVYIKRRNNLLFINEQSSIIPTRELELCFEETVSNLELAGIKSSCFIDIGEELWLSVATAIYDSYEAICEEVFGKVDSMLIRIYKAEEGYVLSIDANSVCPLDITAKNVEVTEENGVYCITARFSELPEVEA